jgi:transcriptional regulator with XRE-family HTH domain
MLVEDVGMKLETYLAGNGISIAAFAEVIRTSHEAVRRYALGERVPRPEIMARISKATNGAVTANDFVPAIADDDDPQAQAAATEPCGDAS